jgi:pyruvate,water dikinase
MKFVKWFEDLSKEDINIAGGKGANLGELTQAKIPVPPGFVVLSSAYFHFLEFNKLRPHIHHILSNCDVLDPNQLETASRKVQKLLDEAEIPDDIYKEVFFAYQKLCEQNPLFHSSLPVAVRSSATAEDLPDASFAGQQDSYLNISGDSNVLIKTKVLDLLFGARSIFTGQKYDHLK